MPLRCHNVAHCILADCMTCNVVSSCVNNDCMSWLITLPTCLSSVQASDYFRESIWGKSASDIRSKAVVEYGRLAKISDRFVVKLHTLVIVFIVPSMCNTHHSLQSELGMYVHMLHAMHETCHDFGDAGCFRLCCRVMPEVVCTTSLVTCWHLLTARHTNT